MDIFWCMPSHGDSRYLGSKIGSRTASLSYLQQVALATDQLGYTGVLVPTGRPCEDSWIVASSLISITSRLKFLLAFRPGLISPSLAVRMASTFDRLSNGRLEVNIVTGGDPVELAGDGLFLDHDQRYKQTEEFLSVWKGLINGETVNFEGEYIKIKEGKQLFLPGRKPTLYFGGSSDAAVNVAANHIDVFLTWGEPPHLVKEKIEKVKKTARKLGKTIRFGIRFHIIVRETEEEAWKAANNLIRYLDDNTVKEAQENFAKFDSVGVKRMTDLHKGNKKSLILSPNLWAGIGLVRSGAATALVGSPEIIVQRLQEYAALGIDTFIFSGYPHLEEAHRVAELIFPKLSLGKNSERAKEVIPHVVFE